MTTACLIGYALLRAMIVIVPLFITIETIYLIWRWKNGFSVPQIREEVRRDF